MCWSTIRATNCSRSTKIRSISFALAILQLDERPRVRVLARRDRFDRFVSVLVFVPRERYDSHIRVKIGDYLASAFIGRVSAFYPFFPDEGPLVRVHFIIGRSGGATPAVGRATLEQEVAVDHPHLERWTRSRRWHWSTRRTKRAELFDRYRDAFSEGFHEAYAPRGRGRRHPRHRGAVRRAPARRRLPPPAGGRPAHASV